MPLTSRLATVSDVDAMTALHLRSLAADEHLGALLGEDFVRASYLWHVTDPMAWVVVAESDGAFIGLFGMCSGPFTTRMLWGCKAALVAALFRRPNLLADRRLWSRLARGKSGPPWVARFCAEPGIAEGTIGAVDASARGQGVFPALIRQCETECLSRGLSAVRGGLYRRNVPCYRAFVKTGWTEVPDMGSEERVYFVRVFKREVIDRFPQLSEAGVPDVAE